MPIILGIIFILVNLSFSIEAADARSRTRGEEQNSTCHYCRSSKIRQKPEDNPKACRSCNKWFCGRASGQYICHGPDWSGNECPACLEICCCAYTECIEDHIHCCTYTRTKKRHERMVAENAPPKWTKPKKCVNGTQNNPNNPPNNFPYPSYQYNINNSYFGCNAPMLFNYRPVSIYGYFQGPAAHEQDAIELESSPKDSRYPEDEEVYDDDACVPCNETQVPQSIDSPDCMEVGLGIPGLSAECSYLLLTGLDKKQMTSLEVQKQSDVELPMQIVEAIEISVEELEEALRLKKAEELAEIAQFEEYRKREEIRQRIIAEAKITAQKKLEECKLEQARLEEERLQKVLLERYQ